MRNLFPKKLIAGLVGLLGLSTIAYALTQPPTVATRRVPFQTTTHYRFTVNWNDGNIGSGIKIGAVPAKAFVTSVKCYVSTAFNAATQNWLGVGTTQALTANGNGDWIQGVTGTTASCVLATLGYQNLTTAISLGLAATSPTTPTGTSGGFDIWVRYVQAGTVATAGQATVVIEYTPDDDM